MQRFSSLRQLNAFFSSKLWRDWALPGQFLLWVGDYQGMSLGPCLPLCCLQSWLLLIIKSTNEAASCFQSLVSVQQRELLGI